MSAVQPKKKSLYVSISAHGYGHFGQMAPILNKLAMEHGNRIRFTIQTGINEDFLQRHLHFEFKHIAKSDDIGMLMVDSMEVKPQKSHRAYRDYHQTWPKEAMLKVREIDRQRADAVVSNVSYLTLAAAKQLNTPSIGICSLNWAYIYLAYCGKLPGSEEIYSKALSHYREADRFLIPTPGMPMSTLGNQRTIGPLARLGNHYPNFRERLNLPQDHKIILVSMGGIPHQTHREKWPVLDNVTWIDAGPGQPGRADIIPIKNVPYSFIDILSQADLVVCKPGYGMFTEATCNGVPVLYVKRDQWPEGPHLVRWLEENNHCLEVEREAFDEGNFAEQAAQLLNRGKASRSIAPTGVGEACGYILEALGL
ncbi:MAG: hypothetical protein MI867_00350 [Pseudomonadales bacterium]|nr:hypothetical protein [Pseudomonadales bacterium]